MKQLYIVFFIFIFCGVAKPANAQFIDTVKVTPGYICQIDSFTIDLHLQVPVLGMYPDTINQYLQNDTLRFKMIYDGSKPAPQTAGTQRIKIRAKTPPATGNYYLYFENYLFYSSIPSIPTFLVSAHIGSFTVCMGAAPLSVPENTSKNELNAKIYPNPTSNFLVIQLPETKSQTVAVTLTDITGRYVLTQSLQTTQPINKIDISALPAGVYMLQLQTKENFKISKIIKQ